TQRGVLQLCISPYDLLTLWIINFCWSWHGISALSAFLEVAQRKDNPVCSMRALEPLKQCSSENLLVPSRKVPRGISRLVGETQAYKGHETEQSSVPTQLCKKTIRNVLASATKVAFRVLANPAFSTLRGKEWNDFITWMKKNKMT
ncbi:mCG146132, partial [Mus musculus]